MKLSFDIDDLLYNMIANNGKKNGRSIAAEVRFQLDIIYGDKK